MNPDKEMLYRGLSHAAWGYFFLNFDFNLGTISILPGFVGYLLLLSATEKLSGERRDLVLLKPLVMLLAGWSALDWLLSWVGGNLAGHILFLDLLITAASLYFHFQFLTDMAALAEQYQPEGDDLDQRLLRRRTTYIVLCTVVDLIGNLPAGLLPDDRRAVIVICVMVINWIVALFIMTGLFGLRQCFREAETAA